MAPRPVVTGRKILCWETTGGDVSHYGCYHFEPTAEGTQLTEELEYDLTLSPVSDAVASFLDEPEKRISADLQHFKGLMESGRVNA